VAKGTQRMNNERQDTPTRGRWARRAATALVGGAIAAGGLAAVAAPAHAAPSGCSLSWVGGGFTVRCTEGDGLYRAKLECRKIGSTGIPYTSYRYGPWAAPGPDTYSTAWCDGGAFPWLGSVERA
jgi:hypothetical protein